MIDQIKKLGPGLLFAGAAIGVSHLVQSTKAGAEFGFGLIWALILCNFFKYPFFYLEPNTLFQQAKPYYMVTKKLEITYCIFIYYFLSLQFLQFKRQ